MAWNDSSPCLAQLPLTHPQYTWPCLLVLSRSTARPRPDTGLTLLHIAFRERDGNGQERLNIVRDGNGFQFDCKTWEREGNAFISTGRDWLWFSFPCPSLVASHHRSTQPSTLCGMVKWVSAFRLSNNNNKRWRWVWMAAAYRQTHSHRPSQLQLSHITQSTLTVANEISNKSCMSSSVLMVRTWFKLVTHTQETCITNLRKSSCSRNLHVCRSIL